LSPCWAISSLRWAGGGPGVTKFCKVHELAGEVLA